MRFLITSGILAAAGLAGVASAAAFDPFAGQKIYETHCAQCHGIDGVPLVPGTPDFTWGEGLMASDGELIAGIKAGNNLMPGYDHILKDREILDVVAYMRTLQR